MKAKKMLIIAFILFLAFGFFMNSSFMNAKKNEVYGMLKEEYGLSSDTDTKEEIEQFIDMLISTTDKIWEEMKDE